MSEQRTVSMGVIEKDKKILAAYCNFQNGFGHVSLRPGPEESSALKAVPLSTLRLLGEKLIEMCDEVKSKGGVYF
jgi:hypothetical protein